MIYAYIKEIKEAHTKRVEHLQIIKKYFTLIFKIEFGIKITKESKADKLRAEKPINEVIYIFFSIDYFFPILFL